MSRAHTPVPDTAPTANGALKEDNGEVELHEIMTGQAKIPLEEDIMQLARLGEIRAIQKLFDEKKFTAKYADEQGITALHVKIRLDTHVVTKQLTRMF